MAWVGLAHAVGFAGVFDGAIAYDVVDFGLTKHFVDRHTQLLLTVVVNRITHCFTRTHDGLQLEFEMLFRRWKGFHHRFERGGKQKGVRHPMRLHQFIRRFRAESATVSHDFTTKVQGGQKRIHQTAGPRPISGAPKNSFGRFVFDAIKAKPVLTANKSG